MPDPVPPANPKAALEAIEIPKPKPQEIEEAARNSFSYIEALKEQVGFSSGKESELKHQHMDWSQKYYLKWVMFGFVLLINVIWTAGIFRILWLTGFHAYGFHLDNNVLITLVSTSIGNFVALVAIVARHLFPGANK